MSLSSRAREAQLRRHLDSADEAERSGDATACANSLRLALTIDPDNLQIRERLTGAERRAATAMADTYLAQGRLAEQNGHLAEAARGFARAAFGKSNPQLYLKAAECLLTLGKDLRTAAEFAKNGLELAPNDAQLHLALGRSFLGAGMRSSAEREINLASRLAPEDDTIRDWLKRLKRREV
jgi:tetratricopeptide (TPR) repeat protein